MKRIFRVFPVTNKPLSFGVKPEHSLTVSSEPYHSVPVFVKAGYSNNVLIARLFRMNRIPRELAGFHVQGAQSVPERRGNPEDTRSVLHNAGHIIVAEALG